MMGGKIWVESEYGKGSTFHFTACFGLSDQETAETIRVKDLDLVGIPLLILDENPANRSVLKEMTSSWDLEPSEAEDEEEALSQIKSAFESGKPYQILLLNSRLSKKDGFGVAKRIKEGPYAEDLRIILLASNGRKGDAEKCAKSGISAYLVKPVNESELLDGILMALGNPTPGRAPIITRYAIDEARSRLRILVVEDNIVNQKVAEAVLKKRRHDVVIAPNGREAIAALDKEDFDIVLMDVQMPEMDGFEATRLIRDRQKTEGKHTPIVAMTAHAMKGDREKCLAVGMDDYVSKPIREDALFSVIDRFASRPHGKRKVKRVHHKDDVDLAAQEVFDLSEAMKSVSGDKGLFSEIASLFLESAADNMSKIRRGIANKDASAVETAAHALKGSVSNFGATRTFEAAHRLERIGRDGKLQEAERAKSDLEQELKALESAILAAVRE
jgi:CheY-like chemotaxis protein